MNYIYKTPKQLINEIRDSSGMVDTAIGIATGMSQTTISRLRSGAMKDTSSKNWWNLVNLHTDKVKKTKSVKKNK